MKNIPLNADVECTDGSWGQSTHVIVNPVTQTVTFFVVQAKKGDQTERLVPVDLVSDTIADRIYLNCAKDKMEDFAPFIETRYLKAEHPEHPDADLVLPYSVPMETDIIQIDEHQIPPDQLAIHRGLGVEATDGWVGRVDEFMLDPSSGHITHLLLREGHLWGKKELSLPLSAVDRVFDDVVYLNVDKQTVNNLPTIPVRRSFGYSDSEIELVVVVFDGPEKAAESLKFLKKIKRRGSIAAIRNSAVLVKDKDGQVSLKEAEDVDKKQGTIFGAVTGGLIGLLAGPVGAVVGAAAGAATGRVAADKIDMGFSNEYLEEMQDSLQPGTSAIIALVEHQWRSSVTEALEDLGGKLFRQALPDEIVSQAAAEFEAEADSETYQE